MPRFVIRPKRIRRTPRRLARALRIITRRWPGRLPPGHWMRDFFMVHPPNSPLNHFFRRHKAGQRQALAKMGIPTPEVKIGPAQLAADKKWIVRPLRHRASKGYNIVQGGAILAPGHYASPVFLKTREYRLVFVYGRLTLVYVKRRPEGAKKADSWAGDGAYFITVNKENWNETALLAHTDVLNRLVNCPVVRDAHILAVDVMYSGKEEPRYRVAEFNACPGLLLPGSLAAVIREIKLHHRLP